MTPRAAHSYRAARRNLARGQVWSAVFHYAKHKPHARSRVVTQPPPRRMTKPVQATQSTVTATVTERIKRRI